MTPDDQTDEIYVFPMSFAQARLWLLDRIEGGSAFYNIATAVRLRGPLDVEALAHSLAAVVERHEALRTNFDEEDGAPVQLVHAASTLTLTQEDVAGGEQALARVMEEEAARPFDLTRDRLLRARLLHLAPDDHVLLLTLHHIIADGWSMGVLVREMGALYRGGADLPQLEIQYPDYTEWQREMLNGPARDRLLGYWRQRLAGAPPLLALPTDMARPPAQSYRGAEVPVALDRATTDGLRRVAQTAGASLFMVLLAGYGALLSRLSGADDIVIGAPVANRSTPEVEPLIGFFVNSLPLRLDLSAEPSFGQLVTRAAQMVLGALDHQDLPFEMMVEALAPERSLSHAPLFQALLTLQNTPGAAPEIDGLTFEPLDIARHTALYDLSLEFTEGDGGLTGRLGYATDLFVPETAARIAGMLTALLRAAVRDPAQAVTGLALDDQDPPPEIRPEPVPEGAPPLVTVHAAWTAQAARTPDAIAVRQGRETVTYAQLQARVQAWVADLRGHGIGPGDRVGVCLGRGPDLIAAMLAVIETGAAYVPLDPAYPPERLAWMRADGGLGLTIDADGLSGAAGVERGGDGDLVYAIFTSGSTGQPKLAGVHPAGFARLLQWYVGAFALGPDDHTLVMTSPSFDLTQKNLFAPLMVGASVVLPESAEYDPAALARLIRLHRVRVLNCTPSAFLPLLDQDGGFADLASLRLVVLGGEPIALARLLDWRRSGVCNALVVNSYGPTECTDVVAYHRLDWGQDPSEPVPIGRPVWGAAVTVHDPMGRVVPPGVVGEIRVRGDGVGAGYLNDAELTAEKFQGGTYATGDLGRVRGDGAVVFLGRMDQQVKVRGYRIEPGEIESALGLSPWVKDAVVCARNDVLVAYVTPKGAGTEPSVLIEYLRDRLPHYMVPQVFVAMEAMPLTPSGKIDRKRLPEPEVAAPMGAPVLPQTLAEDRIWIVWQEVLGKSGFGVTDDFFALGGHSLLAAQVASRLRHQFQTEVPMRLLFERPTIAQLAAHLDHGVGDMDALLNEMRDLPEDEVLRLLDEQVQA